MRDASVGTTVLLRFTSAILILIGLALAGGGAYLASLGGSLYYVIAGLAVIVSGVLYWRGARWGERLYAIMLFGTLGWAFVETGGEAWPLLARLFAPAVLGLWLALPWIRRGLRDIDDTSMWRGETAIASVVLVTVLAVRFGQAESAARVETPPSPVAEQAAPPSDTDWSHYGNGPDGQHYAPLAQVNTQNVGKLQVAWTYHTGEDMTMKVSEATPLKVGDTLYTCGPRTTVFAIDAKTGKEKWRNDPKVDSSAFQVATCRGVAFYHVPDAAGVCADRVIATAPGGILRALDAETGTPCADFGTNGVVDLMVGLGNVNPGGYTLNSAPTVVAGTIVLGAYIADNYDLDIASGVIRAFDAKTGALRWAWDMGVPDRIGPPPEGETYTRSTPNAWPAFAADETLGLVYVPTGNPSPDLYGANRRPFDEKYGSSVIALNIADGRVKWSYQTTHHDLWDYDLPAQPLLMTLQGPDGERPALLQATKRGDIFVLDRRDGSLIVPAPETDVPQGGMPGEALSKTQPLSPIGYLPKPLTEASMWGATPLDQMVCRIKFKQARYDGAFTPPGLYPSLIYPGPGGGVDWGGISVDDVNKVVVANMNDFPIYMQLAKRETVPNADKLITPMFHTPYVASQFGPLLGPLMVPCKQPPWGHLMAIDLKTGKHLWKRVLGTARDTGPLGIPSKLPLEIGTPNFSGTLTTSGGLVFVAATFDHFLRAFDIHTGRKLWEYRLPGGGHGTPMTYMAGGKQYIVMNAGGHGYYGTRVSDVTLAFALPE